MSILLLRTARELLVNVAKHAQAHSVTVCTKRHNNNIRITVEDDGIGLGSSQVNPDRKKAKGFGIFSIRERMHHIEGYASFQSKRGGGTRVTVVAPLKCE